MGLQTAPHVAAAIELHQPELYSATIDTAGAAGFAAVRDDQVARYAEQGYLVVHDAFAPEEIGSARQAILDLIAGGNPEFDWIEVEAQAKDAWPSLSPTERPDSVRKLMDFTRFDARLLAIAEKPELLALIGRLMDGPPVRFQDMALIKPPRLGREKPWHQDHAYFDFPLGTRIVGVWIALDEATVENGCMHVLPGAHSDGPIPHFQRRDWQICDTEMLGRRSTAVPLQAGGCLLFDGLLPHGTPHNHSTARRHALQFHYRPENVSPVSYEERLAIFGGEGRNVSC
jgi:phytanoyl-CoA hydroxylase